MRKFAHLLPVELADLAEDIKAHGQRDGIEIYQNEIIDGRNRFVACGLAGMEPTFTACIEPKGDAAALALVVSRNLKRRHLNGSQRAMVAAKIANLKEGRPPETASIEAVSQTEGAEPRKTRRKNLAESPGAKSCNQSNQ